EATIVEGRRDNGIGAASWLVHYHVGWNTRIRHGLGIEDRHRAPCRVLGIRLVLVHVWAAGTVDDDPRHLDVGARILPGYPVRQPFRPDAEGISGIGVPETVDAVIVPHVPERCPDRLRHQDSVPGVAHVGGIEHRL